MLKHLNLDEMVALLSPWVDDPRQRKLFLSIPEIAALHPRVAEAHEAVVAVQPSGGGGAPSKLRALVDESNEVDRCHDHLARAVSYGIDTRRELCLAEEPADAARAAQCDAVQKKLFPNGLAILNASPLAEAGNTTRIARLLEDEPEIVDFLKSIPAGGRASLLDVVKRWLAKGRELQALERARTEIEATRATTPVSKATIQAARSQWFKVVSLVLSNLEVSRAPARDIEIIRGPVLRASDRAGKRYPSAAPEEAPLGDAAQGSAPGPSEVEPGGAELSDASELR
ncbi:MULTISPECIES: hypothetical protein [Sorangium]|uniref:Uncharacterized protein n=1 Tax=Sorangium cellulosum TaxID=56 RepID=A0A4P2QV89_SORCE|nr:MULTISPECIES: hypothetical protein [Sorangium]AUX34056.1 hypothetical protein SOCE836_062240 [Sorangium cellulosum]WCQ93366.1 hypothetical protein NQZ70_06114 [Sorangium sp. Soce836]